MALSKTKQIFVDVVIPSLKIGVKSFDDLASKVIVDNVSYILKSEAMFAEIRTLIEKAQRSIGLSERAATNELYKIDTYYEELTVKRGELESKSKAKTTERDNIEIELQQLRQTLRSANDSLEAAQREHRNALQRLENAKHQKAEADKRKEIGAGLLAIPVVGWIAGGILLDSGIKDYDNACYMADQAANVVGACENTMQHYSAKITTCSDRSNNLNSKIKQLNWEIEGLDREISGIKDQRVVAADYQIKTRRATNILGGLAKTSNAAELETQNYIAMGALINIVQHVFELSAKMVGQEFFTDPEVQNLIASLQKHEKKLRALPNVSQDAISEYL
ncbi:hypothetical protein ACEWY4_001454 [Coilia grayii]|uniref:Uncharacterized protein n=1 Tax=Coilia grayii TaxID=363190 RepID=A0ABD1KTK2_9TELE